MPTRLGLIRVILGTMLGILRVMPAAASAQDQPAAARTPTSLLRVFLDCNECDTEFVMREVAFVDYVRDRTVADLHVLVTTQETGGGGRSWTVAFIGLARFDGQNRTLTFNTSQIATDDDRRKEFVRVFKIGLVGYAADTPAAAQLDVTWTRPAGASQTTAQDDPWNYWVFRIDAGGNVNGEESNKSFFYRFSVSANRTTENWKINLSANSNTSENTFKIDDDLTIRSESQNWNVNSLIVKSLGAKWSAGGRASVSHSSFSNNERAVGFAPGVEYDFFPYSESTRRILTLQYTIGLDTFNYRELTIFDKLHENVPRQTINASLGLRQPWGSLNASSNYSQHLNHLDRSHWSVDGSADVRLFKGFSLDFFGRYEKIKDQIGLRKSEASTEEVLLRVQQLATGYSYFFNVGISYRFGSIFNNVVNPRFER